MVAMVQFQTTFQTTVQTSSIISTLHTATLYLRQEVQVLHDIGASHVIHEEENVRALDITSIPSVAIVIPPTLRYSSLSLDEALLAMVKDEHIMSKSIRWKLSIMPQWNALAS